MLPDFQIARHCRNEGFALIRPYDEAQLGPASYDLRLAEEIRVPWMPHPDMWIEPSTLELDLDEVEKGYTKPETIGPLGYVMQPGAFLLASTQEYVTIPPDLVARVEGKSSLGRVGLAVHITAGFIDPGFQGTITLEMANLLGRPIRIYPGMRIAQIAFTRMEAKPLAPYAANGHYQGQQGPTESRYRA